MIPGYENTLGRGDWGTPDNVFALASRRWGPFDLDAAAAPWNARAPRFYSLWCESPRSHAAIECDFEDGLSLPWEGRTWINPPYGRGVGAWLAKGEEEVRDGNAERAVFLLPARTDTKWFQRCLASPLASVFFVPGRIRFVGAKAPAPFPSCFVVFDAPLFGGPR